MLFTRVPEPGRAKTRLIPVLGEQGAADLQRAMSSHVARMMRHARVLAGQRGFSEAPNLHVDCEARVVGGTLSEARDWLEMPCFDQGSGDLGERMARAMSEGFARGYKVAAVLGGDCPELDGARITEALHAALEQGASLIPAIDGGYCLFALSLDEGVCVPALFESIEWGTSSVCAQQCARLEEQGIEPTLLAACADVDEADDLSLWAEVDRAWYGEPRSISVIIPTYNEAAHLEECVWSVKSYLMRAAPDMHAEIMVTDGGSTDGTVALARKLGCQIVEGARGRAQQMNAAAARSQSDVLLFVHADTRLCVAPKRSAHTLSFRRALQNPALALGAFTFTFDTDRCNLAQKLWCALYTSNTRKRVKHSHDPYGDQALFCRRVQFNSLGGFGTAPFMEDVLLGERSLAVGEVIVVADEAWTSPRRYVEHGFLKTMLVNRRALRALHKGEKPSSILQWYRAQFKKSGN